MIATLLLVGGAGPGLAGWVADAPVARMPAAETPTPLSGYLADPFVAATLTSPALVALNLAHQDDPGWLGAVPVGGADPHVALVYAGRAPEGARGALERARLAQAGLGVRLVEHAPLVPLIEPGPLSASEDGGVLPTDRVPFPTSGIGPGATLTIAILDKGTFLCSANFVFRDVASGAYYLG
ncbi:MAG: hypothetical protein ACRDH5_02025, partial [bacterium]